MKAKDKWKFAIGTTSRAPQSDAPVHYLIADFDEVSLSEVLKLISSVKDFLDPNNIILQRTTHGWHLYTDMKGDFIFITELLQRMKADSVWIKIGVKRGYFFLADKSEICFPWPVEHMVICYGKEKT